MRKLIIIFFAITPFLLFSQGSIQKEIAWISLKEAKKLANKYDQKILIFFYKKDCPYCEEMKRTALNDMTVINIINNNFFPVKLDSRTKDTIYYNNKAYSNQQPIDHGHTFRHDFYAEVASFTHPSNDSPQSTTPTIVLFNSEFEKIITFPGKQPKELLLRRLKKYIH